MTATAAFLLAFPALFSIVNPLGMAFVVGDLLGDVGHTERTRVVRRVALYALAVMLGALWLGSAIFGFFGVTIEALRVAGGLVVILSSLELLLQPDRRDARKAGQANASRGEMSATGMERAFFPLTMPLTTGPGTIAVAVALGSERPEALRERIAFGLGVSLAAVAIAGIVWVTYWSAEQMERFISPEGQRVISRLSAFLLLSIGVQIIIGGISGVAAQIAASLPTH